MIVFSSHSQYNYVFHPDGAVQVYPLSFEIDPLEE